MTDKAAVRARVLAARAAMDPAERERARAAIRVAVLRWIADQQLPAGARIAAYEPLRTEPGSKQLLVALAEQGFEVIVPITLPDRDLDWAFWQPAAAPASNAAGGLGRSAIGTAAAILVPACAVDRQGNRLGRGGGSYDRALARTAPGAFVAALVYAAELLAQVPTDPWDRPVMAAFLPTGLIQLTPTGRRNSG